MSSVMVSLKRHKKKFVLLIVLILSFHSMLSSLFNDFKRQSTSPRPPRATQSSSKKLNTSEVSLNAAKPKKSPIDMVNDYYPFVDFRFVYPDISPKFNETRNIFMIILVNSAAKGVKYRKRREAIRETWGSTGNCEQLNALRNGKLKDLRWLLLFVLGKAGPGTRDDELNEAEARRYNDMLIGNITDNYINNIIKFYMGHLWANKFDVKYTMKTDDDVYVRIPRVLEYLVNAKLPRPFYGGFSRAPSPVSRRVGVKSAISYKYYEEALFPTFHLGAFFILSTDLLNKLFNYVYIRKPFHTDDAYVGVAMRDFGVKPTNITSFHLIHSMRRYMGSFKDCEIFNWNAFGHSLDPRSIKALHIRVQSLVCKNTTLDIEDHRCRKSATKTTTSTRGRFR
ncbi:beta-1,3-galactosyltransferase 1-like [Dendronephthya gigantea]|uniref:beta-1,3-galactosyltransferase 1-like n=1 Tax=Dendronephthya gigantea TaxID=151771 RepID=UPI00106A8552|nr:beta-1,3-galactosyltransferase 1-like [Dendronephthya gigantea]